MEISSLVLSHRVCYEASEGTVGTKCPVFSSAIKDKIILILEGQIRFY